MSSAALHYRVPLLAKYASYIGDILLRQHTDTATSETLSLYVSRGRLRLDSGAATYSFEDLYTTFDTAFAAAAIVPQRIQKACILGAGLGSVPYLLEKKYQQTAHCYDAIENNTSIIQWAQRYMPLPLLQKTNFICADAHTWVLQEQSAYDFICFDIFKELLTPPQFLQHSFVAALSERLQPNGLLFWNMVSHQPAVRQQAQNFFDTCFSKIFPQSRILKSVHNFVLYAEK